MSEYVDASRVQTRRRLPVLSDTHFVTDAILEALLPGPLPTESNATCSSCAMVTDDGSGFLSSVKCCSYQPRLANYQVGGILADEQAVSPKIRAALRERVRGDVGVSPLGLMPLPTFQLLYEQTSEQTFGRALGLRCPFFDEAGERGTCGIWRYRNAVCFTWFCKHERGAAGSQLWASIRALIEASESAVSDWCVRQLGIAAESHPRRSESVERRNALVAELLGASQPPREHTSWGQWGSQRAEFFIECHRLVATLPLRDLVELVRPALTAQLREVNVRYQALLDTQIPRQLKVGTLHLTASDDSTWRISSYSKYDPLIVPAVLLAALPAFNGRTVRDALAYIDAEYGIVIETGLLTKLLDYAILAPDDGPMPSGTPLDPVNSSSLAL